MNSKLNENERKLIEWNNKKKKFDGNDDEVGGGNKKLQT